MEEQISQMKPEWIKTAPVIGQGPAEAGQGGIETSRVGLVGENVYEVIPA